MQDSSQSAIGRALLLTSGAAAFWFVFIWIGAFHAMAWYIVPLALVCFLYVTAMFHILEVAAVPRLVLTLAAPAPALLVAYFNTRSDDTLGQAAVILAAQFMAVLSVLGSARAAVAAIKSNNAFKGRRAKRERP
jgi:hypothetical protein